MTETSSTTAPLQPAYTAAASGQRLRIWRTPTTGPNSVTTQGLSTIRSRARHAARNDPWAGAALDKLTSNGIGTGIQAKPLWGDEAFRARVQRLWRAWVKVADADGVLDFYAMQSIVWREWHEAGECFIRLRDRRTSDGLPVPLQLQVIEAEQCPADLWSTASNGNAIRAGIEFSKIGARVAYWFYRSHPGEQAIAVSGNELVRVPAESVLHVFEPLRAGQIRGIPRAASVLTRMFHLDSIDDAVLERFKLANLFGGFFTRPAASDPPSPTMVSSLTTETASDDTPLGGLEPATMVELPAGMEVEFTDPPTPGEDYSEFLRGHLLAIAARHGVPYEVLTGDLRNVSDRALRLILNEFRRVIEQHQWLYLIPQFLQPVREHWFDAAILDGSLSVSNYEAARDDVIETLWVPQGWPYSHPVQDVEADIKAIRGGLASRSATILSAGEDPEQVDRELAEDSARADALGLVLDSDPRKTSAAGLTQARAAGSSLPDTTQES